MYKRFVTRTALSVASFLAIATAIHFAAAQEQKSASKEPTVSAKLMPSTAGVAPRRDGTSAPQTQAPAPDLLPEMHVMDYSVIYPETDQELKGEGGPSPADPH